MGKGSKTCEDCGGSCGPRTKICPHCQSRFTFKPKSKNQVRTSKVPFDWRDLKRGVRIKAVQTYGQYSGIFKVHRVHDDGIVVHGQDGYCFLYMGEDGISPTTGQWREPHKLELVK